MNSIKEAFFPESPLIVPSPKNKRYLSRMLYIFFGYIFAVVAFIFEEGILASLLMALQVVCLCSAIFTLFHGMFAFMTACSILNLFHVTTNINKYSSSLGFLLVLFFLYSSYSLYVICIQLKEQYNEQHSVAYKAYYHYVERKILQGNDYIKQADLEKARILGLFNPMAEIEEKLKEERKA